MHDTFPLPDLSWEPTRPFWDAAARGELALPRCDSCGAWCWYPRDRCRACDGAGFTWRAVHGRGTLFSWTVVHHPFLPQFRDLVPFVPALVTLDDAPGVRLVTRVVDVDIDALVAGMPLTAIFRPLRFPGVDAEVLAPLFTP